MHSNNAANVVVFFLSAIVCPWLDLGLPPWCTQVVGEPFSATLAQHMLAECDPPGKIPWNTPPQPGIEPRQWEGQTVSFIHSPLSYHDRICALLGGGNYYSPVCMSPHVTVSPCLSLCVSALPDLLDVTLDRCVLFILLLAMQFPS